MFTPKRNKSLLTASLHSPADIHGKRNKKIDEQVQSYGCPLPIAVSEALSQHKGVSVNIGPTGYIWLVSNCKVLIWSYKSPKESKTSRCYQLSLPQCSAGNQATRVVVVSELNRLQCYSSNAEGLVRYWPDVKLDNYYSECNLGLHDQLVSKLHYDLENRSVLAVTSNCDVFKLKPQNSELTAIPLIDGSGMFSSVSRRFSSFIFGSKTAANDLSVLRNVVTTSSEDGQLGFVYLLTESSLIKLSSTDRIVQYKVNVIQLLAQTLNKQESCRLVDLQPTKSGVLILVALFDTPNMIKFSLLQIYTMSSVCPETIDQNIELNLVTDISNVHQDSDAIDKLLSGYQLLYPDQGQQTAYIKSPSSIYIVLLSSAQEDLNKITFTSQDECILSIGCHKTDHQYFTLIFTQQRHLLQIKSPAYMDQHVGAYMLHQRQMLDSSYADYSSPDHNTSSTVPSSAVTSTEPVDVIKSVFLKWLGDGQPQNGYPVSSLFSLHGKLDDHVCKISEDIVDDVPVNDPRWAHITNSASNRVSLPSTQSVMLSGQLQSKLQIQRQFLTFLTSTSVLDKLSTYKGIDTKEYLYELTEDLVTAKSLHDLQFECPDLIDSVTSRCLLARQVTVSPPLTEADLFYKEVSQINYFFTMLVEFEKDQLPTLTDYEDIIGLICNANIIFINCILEVTKYREAAFLISLFKTRENYIPWTKKPAMLELLVQQCELSREHALPACNSTQESSNLSQQLADMVDIICDGYSSSQAFSMQNERYEYNDDVYRSTRYKLLKTFVDMEQYERGAELAEKYQDFAILIEICEKTGHEERLNKYSRMFSAQGFTEYLFDYYRKIGKPSQILNKLTSTHAHSEAYLQDVSKQELKWLHDIATADFEDAHRVLAHMAVNETENVDKKQTLFSLSKLCAHASDEVDDLTEQIETINKQLSLIAHQKSLSPNVLDHLGVQHGDSMNVLTAEELVKAYISDYNEAATELDFKTALDLVSYCDPSLQHEFQQYIWRQALLRDSWKFASDSPLADCSSKLFFKLIEVVSSDLSADEDLMQHIPALEDILSCDELKDITADRTCLYLLKAGYEHLQQLQEQTM